MTILDLKNLSYDYITKAGAVHALKEATASFETGKVYAIVGRSAQTRRRNAFARRHTKRTIQEAQYAVFGR